MIAALLIWVYAGAVCYLYGASALVFLARLLDQQRAQAIGLPLTLVVGLAQVTALASILSLVMPLGVAAAIILLTVGVLMASIARPPMPWKPRWPRGADLWPVIVMLLALLICLESGTRPPANPDTNSYHAQTIRWIETYRAVPGLGNLSGRLALNSTWLLLQAAFSFSFLNIRSFHVLGSFLFLIVMLHFAGSLRRLPPGDASVGNLMQVLLIGAAFWVLPGELSSPGTDLPAILLTWFLLSSALEYEANGAEDRVHAAALACIPVLMTVLKLSAAPMLLITAYILARSVHRRDARLSAVIAASAALLLAPWMIRSVILSGYLIYPYSQLDIFALDWKVPAADAGAMRNAVLGWSRLPASNWPEALSLPPAAWIPQWLQQRTPNQLVMLALALLSPAGLLPMAHRKYALPTLAAHGALLAWFLTAPNWRFGYGVVIGLAALLISAVLSWGAANLRGGARAILTKGPAPALTLLLLVMAASMLEPGTLDERLLLPADYYRSRVAACELDGLPIYCAAVNRQCGYDVFPCIPGLPRNVRARGSMLQEGFYSIELEGRGTPVTDG